MRLAATGPGATARGTCRRTRRRPRVQGHRARLVDIAVHLGFMLTRSWPPYSKWRGSAFGQLAGCSAIATDLDRTLDAARWESRQTALRDALTGLADLQRQSGLPAPQPAVEPFWDRPHLHLSPHLVPALLETIRSPEVQALPAGLGSVEKQTDNVAILTNPHRRSAWATCNPRSPIDRRTTSVCSIRKCVLPPRLPQTGNATADRPSTPISCHRAGPPGAMLYAMPIPRKLPVSAPGPTKVAGLSSQVRRHVTQVRPKRPQAPMILSGFGVQVPDGVQLGP